MEIWRYGKYGIALPNNNNTNVITMARYSDVIIVSNQKRTEARTERAGKCEQKREQNEQESVSMTIRLACMATIAASKMAMPVRTMPVKKRPYMVTSCTVG